VFSLDFLNPKYELKLGGKVLGQLSPGERGASGLPGPDGNNNDVVKSIMDTPPLKILKDFI